MHLLVTEWWYVIDLSYSYLRLAKEINNGNIPIRLLAIKE
jgi:hypothetical protein